MRRTAEERQQFVEDAAARMTANPTTAEARLWEVLEPLGFKRQWAWWGLTKNGGEWQYILDFFHDGLKLCVEVDGGIHKRRKGRDRRRDTRLAGEGIRTLRFSNRYVLDEPTGVKWEIQAAMDEKP